MTERAKKFLNEIENNELLKKKLEELIKNSEKATDEERVEYEKAYYEILKEYNLEELTDEDIESLECEFAKDELDEVAGGFRIPLPAAFPPFLKKPVKKINIPREATVIGDITG